MINDVILSQTSPGTYDWRFEGGDVVSGGGTDRLQSAIIHAILLELYEMETDYYELRGCKAHDYIGEDRTEHVQILIEESIADCVRSIHGVRDAKVTVMGEANTVNVRIIILQDDGTEVLFDGATI